MKHFVTLAALLTSLSAFAQLPYNPDSNNDGQIGAVDLTALLSVYSTNFSNGVIGSGTQIATSSADYPSNSQYFYIDSSAESWVCIADPWGQSNIYVVFDFSNGSAPFNGLTITLLHTLSSDKLYLPEGDGSNYQPAVYLHFDGADNYRAFTKAVYWDGEWYSATGM